MGQSASAISGLYYFDVVACVVCYQGKVKVVRHQTVIDVSASIDTRFGCSRLENLGCARPFSHAKGTTTALPYISGTSICTHYAVLHYLIDMKSLLYYYRLSNLHTDDYVDCSIAPC